MASMPQVSERPPPPCPSWVYSNNSDTHVAKDRCWFGQDYIPFRSYVTDIAGGSVEVIGMGTVNLATMSSPMQTHPNPHSSLRLKNVLHAPTMLCNIIGSPVRDDYTVMCGPIDSDMSGFLVRNADGRIMAYFKPMGQGPRLFQVQLGEPPLGHALGLSPLCPNGLYMIHAFWSQRERRRFEILKASGLTRASGVQPLTLAEKNWFGMHRMSERAIMLAYGLNHNRQEHREEGRAIMRILKAQTENEPKI
ncbi:hypothetical protein PITC_075780 [Penicillium italicum]|uniref:Uncharacterized protein n=1 Tax=Penicillium italicum TaxID=40296 RepID=A0A0A2L6A2_PENIT|nr:hypothetical protein PITC_075780 [Penicillium italicum]